uniref:Dehydrogenase E1 component domain-containing protein n=1 Tax=Panagrolaimus sp. JU765 TaxID=591449 RepID=A0AC34RDS0_9BILA
MISLKNTKFFALKSVEFRRYFSSQSCFQTYPYKLFKLDQRPASKVSCTKDELLKYYQQMQTIRKMENLIGNLYSELMGKSSGNVHGKGGSMHMYEEHFYGGNGIVGAQVPLGGGIALAMKHRKQKNVCFALYGDGAANQGQVFETMNMAKLWKLPIVFVCENNGFGMGTSAERSSASTDYYTRGDYIPGLWVDAMDVLTVREATKFCKEWCNSGNGPLVMELHTYRYVGHSVSDPGTSYRKREEVEAVRKAHDPIRRLKEHLITSNSATQDEVKKIDKGIQQEIDQALEIVSNDPDLPKEGVYCDIYSNTNPQLVRGVTFDESIVQPYTTTSQLLQKLGRQLRH